METAYFAGGCFWCITPGFREMAGVANVISGYSGGREENPAYEDVKHQRTGHRETIRIDFDPAIVSFDELLTQFLNSVDPFDDGGQFIDRGHSYTLAVYYTNEAQRLSAYRQITALEIMAGMKTAVSLEKFTKFWRAEEYHQDYYRKHPEEFRKELIDSGRMKG